MHGSYPPIGSSWKRFPVSSRGSWIVGRRTGQKYYDRGGNARIFPGVRYRFSPAIEKEIELHFYYELNRPYPFRRRC